MIKVELPTLSIRVTKRCSPERHNFHQCLLIKIQINWLCKTIMLQSMYEWIVHFKLCRARRINKKVTLNTVIKTRCALNSFTCRAMDEYSTCITSELDDNRTKTILSMQSFDSISSTSCLRSIAAKGAPTHFCSRINDYIQIERCDYYENFPMAIALRLASLKNQKVFQVLGSDPGKV